MSRFSRIKTIWRKELLDTFRDRRTLIAMVLVPILLYPVLMLGSLQAVELQQSQAQESTFRVAVPSEDAARWLRARLDTDISRQLAAEGVPAEQLPELEQKLREMSARELLDQYPELVPEGDVADAVARLRTYEWEIVVAEDVRRAVAAGTCQAGLLAAGDWPTYGDAGSGRLILVYDATDYRSSNFAGPGLSGMLDRLRDAMVLYRLTEVGLSEQVLDPFVLETESVATPEQVGGYTLGLILPLILITMTITGAIYPAIDLTAGERERGTLETLMVAPVPTVDLIAGKFVVVTLIGMLSATLNLMSMGATVYFGGFSQMLSGGTDIVFPLTAFPLILLVMIPLAVMFSAVLLAVCSFARSFKEAQNYIMPVMVAAMIPAVIGSLPGTRLEGPLLAMPVTNIVVLTRELFVGRFDVTNILWVTITTCLYAGATVAIAAKLFGQEAVLFADSGSVKSLFVRRFFKPRARPTTSQALLLLAAIYLVNFFVQQSLYQVSWLHGTPRFFAAVALVLVVLLGIVPFVTAGYLRIRPQTAFRLNRPQPLGWAAALCLGASTWLLALAWWGLQRTWLPMLPEMQTAMSEVNEWLSPVPVWLVIAMLAVVPGLVEELFFRGFVLSGLRGGLGVVVAVLVTAFAFAMFHHSVHRFVVTGVLGVVFAILVIRSGSIWPAVIAHMMHNAMPVLASRVEPLTELLQRVGVTFEPDIAVQPAAAVVALVVAALGIGFCLMCKPPRESTGDERQYAAPEPTVAPEAGG